MKKNILVVDDSALMRRVLSDIINSDDRFCVKDIAMNGLEAFDLIIHNHVSYDAIILDINMPKMNGLKLLEKLSDYRIKIIVIVVSTVAKKGAKETIRALELGAFDFVTKPESFLDVKSGAFKSRIIECLEVGTKVVSKERDLILNSVNKNLKQMTPDVQTENIMTKKTYQPSNKKAKKLVALACSTGGPKALQSVISKLDANIDAAILIVQHMPEGFTNSLALRLNEISSITVKEAEHGEVIQKGIAYVAKGGSQMRVVKQLNKEYTLSVTVEVPVNGLMPCANIMYESLQNSNYDEITCVVLTGMGGDGTQGIKKLKETNNIHVIAQDEATSTVYGMPKVLAEAGLADEVLPLSKISDAIMKNVGVQ